jgi:hypothetical protein
MSDDEQIEQHIAEMKQRARAAIDTALRESGAFTMDQFDDKDHVGLVDGDIDTTDLAEAAVDAVLNYVMEQLTPMVEQLAAPWHEVTDAQS